MYRNKSAFFCDTDYYSQYQSMYDQVIIFDQDVSPNSADSEQNSYEEESMYSDIYDTSIEQPSHPYNGDITPMA